jgi:hypothetical protein
MARVIFIGGRVIDETFHPDFMTAADSRREAERLLLITAEADQETTCAGMSPASPWLRASST